MSSTVSQNEAQQASHSDKSESRDEQGSEPYTTRGGHSPAPAAANSNEPPVANDNDPPPTPAAPGARVRESIFEYAAFRSLADFVRDELPGLNNAVRDKQIDFAEFVQRAEVKLIPARFEPLLADLAAVDARAVLQMWGFVISSIERHSQQAGAIPGQGLAQIAGADPLLVALSAAGQHPPRDSYFTYWLNNAGPRPLTFTGNPQEEYFNKAVNETAARMLALVGRLREFRIGRIAFDFEEVADVFDQGQALITALLDVYRNYRLINPSTGQRHLEPEFFMTEMRQYLLPYPVGGQLVQGPNATYSPAWALCDLALGNRDLRFIEVLCRRRPWILNEDWHALVDNFGLMAVPDLLVARLGLTVPAFLSLSETTARRVATEMGAARAFAAYGRLVDSHRMLSATHWSLIVNYLLKPSEKLDQNLLAALPVKPNHGVSATPVEATKQNDQERRNNPLNRRFIEWFARSKEVCHDHEN